MNYPYKIILLLLFSASAEGAPIWVRNFEDGVIPGTVDGASKYADMTWYLESEGSGHHVRYDFTVPADPVQGASWYGGLSTNIGNFSSLPPVWQLSFRVATSATVPEPIKVKFSLYTKPRLTGGPLAQGVTLAFWITPAGTGWQQVVVQSRDVKFVQGTFTSARISTEPDTFLEITVHSRGPAGEALSLSEAGNHYLMLGDLDFRIPVVPFVSIQPRSDGKLSLFYTGTLQQGGSLDDWATLLPQPAPHSLIDPTGSRRFYRASGE